MTETTRYRVDGMHCAACVARVESALCKLPGVETAAVNLASHEVTLRSSAEQSLPTASDLAAAVATAGYTLIAESPVESNTVSRTEERAQALRQLRARVLVAAGPAIAVLIISMSGLKFPGDRALLALLTLIVLGWSGRSIFQSAASSALHLSPNMDTLVAIGSGTAYLVSLLATFFGSAIPIPLPIMFDAAAMTVFFVLLGRFLEERAKGNTLSA
ncbi:MAG: cation-translocating P-type ATPase, partial [Planctomycetaceae bacterium]|nr:cation-translocating P-type ATPase [Planctomycetaceae bacterium]